MSFLLDALQGQGLPTWMEVSPLGASDGVPGALRVHGSTPDPYPQPTTQAPRQVGRQAGMSQTINSGLGFLTF